MSRGLLVLFIQILVCVATTGLGLWTLLRPKSFQAFLHENFGLLPPVSNGSRLTPLLIRLSSIFLLWYAAQLFGAFRTELLWIGHIVDRLAG